ncbi:LIC11966 family surface protein [Leptospira koniambonensis]|uniref:LIC11966 family surface protein n=1 Tax=Leptospira koniambonensis TaxID=2484950 RepID=UPI003EBAE11E
MKYKRIVWKILVTLLVFSFAANLTAKSSAEALKYLNELTDPVDKISADRLSYIQALAHSNSKQDKEAKRAAIISSVEKALLNANQATKYDGSSDLKDAVIKYLNVYYTVLREDYGKLVDLKEAAEQSYDAMEAYMLAEKKAGDKLHEAAEKFSKEQKVFAKDNDITLYESKDRMSQLLKKSGEVMSYKDEIYLIDFKPYKQEFYLLQALKDQDVKAIEQNRETLLKYAEEGLKLLDKVVPYDGDSSLIQACKNNLSFYKMEAKDQIPTLIEFHMKEARFDAYKKKFNEKEPKDRSQEDVDTHNKLLGEVNSLVPTYNKINQTLNKQRGVLIEQWNKSNKNFLSKHVPKK